MSRAINFAIGVFGLIFGLAWLGLMLACVIAFCLGVADLIHMVSP